MRNKIKEIKHNYQTILLVFLFLVEVVKPFFMVYIFDYNISIIFFTIIIIDIFINLKKITIKGKEEVFFLIIIFYSYVLFTSIYSPSDIYIYNKWVVFIVNLLFFLYPLFIKKINLSIFYKVYMLILVPISLFFIYMKSLLFNVYNDSTENFMDLRGNYLSIGLNLGILILLANYLKKNIYIQLFLCMLLFASTARGPFLFLLLIIIIFNFRKLVLHKLNQIIKISKYGVLVLFTFFLFRNEISNYTQNSILRYLSLGKNDESFNTRLKMYDFVVQKLSYNISDFLIGRGFASFGIDFYGVDKKGHPHNIFLEIFYETGALGVFIFLLIIVVLLVKSRKKCFYIIFIYLILNSLKSTTIAEQWSLFGIMGCMLSSSYTNKDKFIK